MDNTQVIKSFYKLLNKHVDHVNSVGEFSSFFIRNIRSQSENTDLPLVEMMSILKHERPMVTYLIKKHQNMALNMLMEMDMEYSSAEEVLKKQLTV